MPKVSDLKLTCFQVCLPTLDKNVLSGRRAKVGGQIIATGAAGIIYTMASNILTVATSFPMATAIEEVGVAYPCVRFEHYEGDDDGEERGEVPGR